MMVPEISMTTNALTNSRSCRQFKSVTMVHRNLRSAMQSKNAVCANIKHNRYFHLTSNFRSIYSHGKRLYGHTFDIVNIAFSY